MHCILKPLSSKLDDFLISWDPNSNKLFFNPKFKIFAMFDQNL